MDLGNPAKDWTAEEEMQFISRQMASNRCAQLQPQVFVRLFPTTLVMGEHAS
jgi:hypothetical protein